MAEETLQQENIQADAKEVSALLYNRKSAPRGKIPPLRGLSEKFQIHLKEGSLH